MCCPVVQVRLHSQLEIWHMLGSCAAHGDCEAHMSRGSVGLQSPLIPTFCVTARAMASRRRVPRPSSASPTRSCALSQFSSSCQPRARPQCRAPSVLRVIVQLSTACCCACSVGGMVSAQDRAKPGPLRPPCLMTKTHAHFAAGQRGDCGPSNAMPRPAPGVSARDELRRHCEPTPWRGVFVDLLPRPVACMHSLVLFCRI
jgi:hypothetical protein